MVQNSTLHDSKIDDLMAQPEAIRAALEGIVTIDGGFRIAMVNPAAERMFGRRAADLLGMELAVLVPERSRVAHAAHVQRFMDSEALELSMAGRGPMVGLRANGEEFPMESALCKLKVADGRVYCTALLRDLSEERKLTLLVEQINHRMRSLFDLVPVAIWIMEGDSVVYANPACARLFGSDLSDSFTGRSVYQFLSPGTHDRVRSKVAQALENEEAVFTLDSEIARHDGTVRQVGMVLAALPDHHRTLVQMFFTDITPQAQERRELLRARHTLRGFSASLVETREEERRRIARELHDELGQRLTALKLELSSLGRAGDIRISAERTQAMIDMIDDTVAATRRISMDLRPLMLDDLGLNAAIEWQAREFERRTGLRVSLSLAETQHLIDSGTATALYRIVQEALTNITRHARANRVQITVSLDANTVELSVQDDGEGFPSVPPKSVRGSFGLIGIRERVIVLGGSLSIVNAPKGGALLKVRLPLGRQGSSGLRAPIDTQQAVEDFQLSIPGDLRPER
jgi:two-component system, NarL family, sensor histidine kinase UhpB